MRMTADSLVKIIGIRGYRFRDEKQQREVVGCTIHYLEKPTQDELKNGFLGDKVGVCNIPGNHPEICLGCLGRIVYDHSVYQGEHKLRSVDFIIQSTK